MACRYPRLDSGERRLSSTAALLWSRSGRPSFDFGRFDVVGFRLARLLIPAASSAAGRKPMPALKTPERVTRPNGRNEIAECQPTSSKRFCSLFPEGVKIVIFALILVLLPNRYTNRPEQV